MKRRWVTALLATVMLIALVPWNPRAMAAGTPNLVITESDGSTQVCEGGATDTVMIGLAHQPLAWLTSKTVTLTTSDGQATVSPASLRFDPWDWYWDRQTRRFLCRPQTVTVAAVEDAVDEDAAHPGVIGYSVSSADPRFNGTGSITVSVLDNDIAGVRVSKTEVNVIEHRPDSLRYYLDGYTVALTSQPTDTVIVTVTPDPEVTVSAATLVFTPASWDTPQTVTVAAVDDLSDERQYHAGLITHEAASADPNYSGIGVASVTVRVRDNDNFQPGELNPASETVGDRPFDETYYPSSPARLRWGQAQVADGFSVTLTLDGDTLAIAVRSESPRPVDGLSVYVITGNRELQIYRFNLLETLSPTVAGCPTIGLFTISLCLAGDTGEIRGAAIVLEYPAAHWFGIWR